VPEPLDPGVFVECRGWPFLMIFWWQTLHTVAVTTSSPQMPWPIRDSYLYFHEWRGLVRIFQDRPLGCRKAAPPASVIAVQVGWIWSESAYVPWTTRIAASAATSPRSLMSTG